MPARVVLGLLLVQGLQRTVAWACSCTADAMDVSEETFDLYGQIFVGTVRSTGGGGCDGQAHTRFEVTEAFQGVAEGDIVRVAHSVDGASCGMTFEDGQDYLVTVFGEDSVSLCSPTAPVAQAQDQIETLRELTAQ